MKDGDIIRLIRVRFPGQSLPGVFRADSNSMIHGQQVVAMSDRGLAVGFINSQVYKAAYNKEMGEIPFIKEVASDEDFDKYKAAYQKQREASTVFNQLVEEFELPMVLEDVEFTGKGKKNVFYYTAPTRVDFRDLLKALSTELKGKIELRQILDVNLKKSEVGPCGPDLCLFINSFVEHTGKEKKCSEIFCCLENNDPFYDDKRSRLPKNYSIISTHTGETGKVLSLDYVKEEFEMLTDQGIVKRYVSEMYKENLNKKAAAFPKNFETISYDTKNVIGKDKRLAQQQLDRDAAYEKGDESAKEFSEEVWKNINE